MEEKKQEELKNEEDEKQRLIDILLDIKKNQTYLQEEFIKFNNKEEKTPINQQEKVENKPIQRKITGF